MLDATQLVRLLADEDRRRVVAALVLGSSTLPGLEAATGLDTRAVATALTRLIDRGLVEEVDDGYVLLEAAFAVAARASVTEPPPSAHPDAPAEVARVLDTAFRDGRLINLPAKQAKRLIVLDHISQRFEPGERYTEKQVNASISQIYADTATIRRYLVDHGFMDRGDGDYWRSGGTV